MADLRRLQRLIDATAKAHAKATVAENALMDECHKLYGKTPSDVDADQIIDSVLGGCGVASGMDASEFDEIMRELTGADHA